MYTFNIIFKPNVCVYYYSYKGAIKFEVTNYRPVAIISTAKIFEIVIHFFVLKTKYETVFTLDTAWFYFF